MKTKYQLGARIVRADYYTTSGKREEILNPLVAALEPRWTKEMIATAMTWWPDYEESDRSEEPDVREDRVMELDVCFETLPQHLSIVKAILNAERIGYRGRDRFVHGFTAEIEATAEKLAGGERVTPPPESNGRTILLYGYPGNGKTALVSRLSVLRPQVIIHTTFRDKPFPCRQVVYIRVVAQINWTDRAMAQAILEEFDRAAKTDYALQAAKKGASFYAYILQFNLAAHNHGLGTLIIDEVQLLANNESLLTFLLNFNTLVGVPLVLVGTPSSQQLMRDDPRYMRRADGFFDPEFKRFLFPTIEVSDYDAALKDENGARDDWTFFVEAFWGFQYTTEFTPLTHELSFALHYFSAGVIDYAIKLFIAAQLLRIGSGKDRLDKDAFQEAYLVCFKTSTHYLEALRDNKVSELIQYEDFKGIDVSQIATDAAKARMDARLKDDKSRLEEARRQRRKASPQKEKAPKPDPVGKEELPVAPADEFKI